MKNSNILVSVLMALLFMGTACNDETSEEAVVEEEEEEVFEGDGLVIVELESAKSGLSAWGQGTTTVNGKEITYIYAGIQSLDEPGKQQLNFPIEIGIAGTYRFVWHCKVGEGDQTSEENDNWLKIQADEFYGRNKRDGETIVRPHGVCTDDCPEGSGKNGWFKIYSNVTTDWTWRTYTNDGDAFEIFATFNEPGIYNVSISARSAHQFLDRFVLFHVDEFTEAEATDLSKEPTH